MEASLLIGLCLLATACATSTATRKVPGLVLDTLRVASGQPFGPSSSDHKSQITLVSHISQDLICQSLQSNLVAEITGPTHSNRVLATGSFDKSGVSTIVTEAPPGKYTITLVNSRGSKKIKAIDFESTEVNDRFNFYFKNCD